jgi:hypothetical protein
MLNLSSCGLLAARIYTFRGSNQCPPNMRGYMLTSYRPQYNPKGRLVVPRRCSICGILPKKLLQLHQRHECNGASAGRMRKALEGSGRDGECAPLIDALILLRDLRKPGLVNRAGRDWLRRAIVRISEQVLTP